MEQIPYFQFADERVRLVVAVAQDCAPVRSVDIFGQSQGSVDVPFASSTDFADKLRLRPAPPTVPRQIHVPGRSLAAVALEDEVMVSKTQMNATCYSCGQPRSKA